MSTSPTRAVVVDDERNVAAVVAEYLQREGFTTWQAHDGLEALSLIRQVKPDVVILDVMLPSLDGYEVCRRLRTFSDAYVLMLTARGEETDAVIGLSSGADDYLVKPFGPRELVARVKALLRRPRSIGQADEQPHTLSTGQLELSLLTRRATYAGLPVDLTRTEFDILAALAARPRAVQTRHQIIEAVWGADWVGDDHVVDVHIAHVRSKLEEVGASDTLIRTVRGVGYAVEAAP